MNILVTSVGGSLTPIEVSIGLIRPNHVIFFTSKEVKENISEMVSRLPASADLFSYDLVLTENINDLLISFQKAREIIQLIRKLRDQSDVPPIVTVDYTGGTKNMSVALALAFLFEGYPFQYVGGKQRTKEGIGQVVSGSEEIYSNINPWTFLAIQEKKTIRTLLNQNEFEQASRIALSLSQQDIEEREDFYRLGKICEALHYWDLFRYKDALNNLSMPRLTERTEKYGWYKNESFASFAGKIKLSLPTLRQLAETQGKPTLESVFDLISNADRRSNQGKYDDAVLRLYRSIEMLGQVELLQYGILSENVDLEKIPERLREEFSAKRDIRDGKIKIGLRDSWKILHALGNEKAKEFEKRESELASISFTRNNSLLAHGFKPIKNDLYGKLRELVLLFGGLDNDLIYQFPKFEDS